MKLTNVMENYCTCIIAYIALWNSHCICTHCFVYIRLILSSWEKGPASFPLRESTTGVKELQPR